MNTGSLAEKYTSPVRLIWSSRRPLVVVIFLIFAVVMVWIVLAKNMHSASTPEQIIERLQGAQVAISNKAPLTEQVFARGEYRYTDYGSKEFDLPLGSREFDSSNHRVTVGLGLKF